MGKNYEVPSSDFNRFGGISKAVAMTAVAASLSSFGTAQAATTEVVPGTGGGIPGIAGFMNGSRVNYPELTPVIDNMPLSVNRGTETLNSSIAAVPGLHDIHAFSQGTLVARQSNTNYLVSAKVTHETMVGDPCNLKGGILEVSNEARDLAGMGCPPENTAIPKTIIYDVEDPIAHFHYPVNLIDLANEFAAYENRHVYNPQMGQVTTSHIEGNDTYINVQHRESALYEWLVSRGIRPTNEQRQFILNALPPGYGPLERTKATHASGQVAAAAPVLAPIRHPAVETVHSTVAAAPEVAPVQVAVHTTARSIERAVPALAPQVKQAEGQISTAITNAVRTAPAPVRDFLHSIGVR